MVLELGDWVWVHMRKERFPKQRKSKLQAREDRPFQLLERINENAYKIDIPGDDFEHLREKAFQEGGSDENPKLAKYMDL